MIGITAIAYNQWYPLAKMLKTASETTSEEVQFFIFRHTEIPEVIQVCNMASQKYGAIHYPHGTNRGVARSWNDGLIAMQNSGCDVMIICNDDIWFSAGDISALAIAARENRDRYIIQCAGWHDSYDVPIGDHGMACCVIQPIMVETVGYLDENFFPAYNEDTDYAYRAQSAKLEAIIIPDTMIHHIGSAAIRSDDNLKNQNYLTHGLNDQYWQKKWGCNKGEHGHYFPFNDPAFHPWFIGKERRHAPYPGYNRQDQDIVKR
jgi:GT2 family glycosyltransferase